MSKIFNRFYRLFLLSLLGFLISTTHSYGHMGRTAKTGEMFHRQPIISV